MESLDASRDADELSIQDELVLECWTQSRDLIANRGDDPHFTEAQFREEINNYLRSFGKSITKQKIETRREKGILNPTFQGKGKQRHSWRYSLRDVQVNIFIELLRMQHGQQLPYRELKDLIFHLETTGSPKGNRLTSPLESARNLLQNRLLGTLLAVLVGSTEERSPRESVIALKRVPFDSDHPNSKVMIFPTDVRRILDGFDWNIGVGDSRSKLYIHWSLDDVFTRRPEVVGELNGHHWYQFVLIDKPNLYKYHVVVGLTRKPHYSQDVRAFRDALDSLMRQNSFIDLSFYPGLAFLLNISFSPLPAIQPGTPISAICEILKIASRAWDFVGVLLPRNHRGPQKANHELHLQDYSTGFLEELGSDSAITLVQNSEWQRLYRNGVVIEPVVELDPRLPFRHTPRAAAVLPIESNDEQILGLLYVIRTQATKNGELVFTDELIAALRAIAAIFGDLISRDDVELTTVRILTRQFQHGSQMSPFMNFPSLESLTEDVSKLLLRSSSEDLAEGWLYLATLTIWFQSSEPSRSKILSESLCKQIVQYTAEYLSDQLRNVTEARRLPVGIHRIDSDNFQYVLPILALVSLREEDFKEKMKLLQQELEILGGRWMEADIFTWGITLPAQSLPQYFETSSQQHKKTGHVYSPELIKIIEGAAKAGPFINSGHKHLQDGNLDEAVTDFEQAKRTSPWNWYVHKHLAEIRMLQGRLPEAEEIGREAIQLNSHYASGLCLLADILAFQNHSAEAIARYSQAIRSATPDKRPSYLIRSAITLANMSKEVYHDTLKEVRKYDATISLGRFHDDPLFEALNRIDEAQRLTEREARRRGSNRNKLIANYHYHRGMTYLRSNTAANIQKALDEFFLGRKLDPENLFLADAIGGALHLKNKLP